MSTEKKGDRTLPESKGPTQMFAVRKKKPKTWEKVGFLREPLPSH